MKNKGGNDLYDRLFTSKIWGFTHTKPVWYGKLIGLYYVMQDTDEFFNLDYKSILNSNEQVSFNLPSFEQQEKIIWRQTADRIVATLDTEKRWFRNTIQCGYLKDEYKDKLNILFVLGVMNSHFLKSKYDELVREGGRVFPQVKLTYLRQLPFVIPSCEEQLPIITLVDHILAAKKANPLADTTAEEREIDRLVYDLYGLTEDEIAIVEGANK